MVPPVLAPVMTPALLSALKNHPSLPRHTWYIIASSTLTVLNRPDEIPKVYAYAVGAGGHDEAGSQAAAPEEQLSITRRIREALIKTAAIGGLPKTINSMHSLKDATPDDMLDEPGSASPSGRAGDVYEVSPAEILQRGKVFFEEVYGKLARRIMGRLDGVGSDDLGLATRLVYGHIISNTKILSPVETSLVMIAGLIPQDVNPQLKGHLRGALNGGATVDEVRAVREVTMMICEASGMKRLAEDAVGGWGWRSDVSSV